MATIKDKLRIFDELIVEHRRFDAVREELLDCIQNAVRGMIIFVLGPSGVGKSRLRDFIYAVLLEYVEKHRDLNLSAPWMLEAKRPEVGEFNWKAFYDQALRRLGEPSLERKVNLDEIVANLRLESRSVTYRVLTTPEMRELYEQALDLQRPIATLIDEAQSIGHCGSDERRMANLDVIKGLSNAGKTVYVLFATYEARNLLRCNAQLARRVRLLDFGRYGDTEEDQAELLSVVKEIGNEVGFRLQPALKRDWEYFYKNSLGCVGILAQWLARALNHAYRNKRVYVTKNDLDATRLSTQDLRTIAAEIKAFEDQHREDGKFDVMQFLKGQTAEQVPDTPVDERKPRGRRRPGARNPFRDPVGRESGSEGSQDEKQTSASRKSPKAK
jgi:hypothetical protein